MVIATLATVLSALQLQRDGKPVFDLRIADCMIYQVPADWRAAVRAARKANAELQAKDFYVTFLKQRYGYRIAALNEVYGLDVASFTDLMGSDFARLDEAKPEILADDVAFAAEIFTQRVESALRGPGKVRLVEIPEGLPEKLVRVLSGLAVVDGILTHGPIAKDASTKPVVLWNCPAVRPGFAAACLRI